MNSSKSRQLFLYAALVVLFVALPCARAQEGDHENPDLYPGAWYRILLGADGKFMEGEGDGYSNGTWYHYPQTGWYRQWFYNQPYDPDREGFLKYEVYIKAVDPTRLTYVEINFNWTTPEWSALGLKRPPLPGDAGTADKEARYMASRRVYLVDNWYIGTVEPIYSHIIKEYNPEWISIDVRGRNAYLFRGAMHECREKQGACCNTRTGECTLTYEDECLPPMEWLGPGTDCDACTQGSAGGLDFGDAPDARYKTLSTSNGPRHTKVTGIFLGRTVDVEVEAKPDSSATGDDIQGSDDDDGVVFTSPLVPGEPAMVEVTASITGYLNAWMDFNQDGDFADTGEQIFTDGLLAPGLNRLSFRVPPMAVRGTTFARFRFSTRGLLTWDGPAADGEVEDYRIAVAEQFEPQTNSGKGGLKWSQAPQRFDTATPFIFNAWGERSDLSLHRIDADDWQCEDDHPVTGLQWWGSFEGWTQPMLPPELPLAFYITIWTNAANTTTAGAAPSGRPDTIVWESFCTNWTWSLAGYNNDPRGLADDTCFQFTCLLSQDQWFTPVLLKDKSNALMPATYWLSIAVIYDATTSTAQHPWGWTTRPQFFGTGATQISAVTAGSPAATIWPPTLGSRWSAGTQIENPKGTRWDLAFELLTNQASMADTSDLAPVYRFWSDTLATHFYTINEAEKDTLIRDFSHVWKYETIAFYAYPPDRAPVGSKPVYRFWSPGRGRHFYTIDEAEKQKLMDEQSKVWTQEGIAWYAFD